MKDFEKEKILYRILSGKTILNKLRLDVFAPSLDLLYEAEEIYCEFYSKTGILSKEELKFKLLQDGIISLEDNAYIEGFDRVLKELQKELFYNFYNPIQADQIRKLIKEGRKKYNKILNEVCKYDTYSREGLAHYSKSIFLIRNTTYRNNLLYDFIDKQPITVLEELNQLTITNDDIRNIAKSSSWTNTWFSVKDFNIFQKFPTIEQQLLVMWSKIYDNIKDSQESPGEEVIQDNDALDGWLIVNREKSKEKEREVRRNKGFAKNSKINNAEEVFIIVRDELGRVSNKKEDIERIQKLNERNALKIQKERLEQIYTKGSVDHHNFHDVRRDIQIKFNQLQMEHIKGK